MPIECLILSLQTTDVDFLAMKYVLEENCAAKCSVVFIQGFFLLWQSFMSEQQAAFVCLQVETLTMTSVSLHLIFLALIYLTLPRGEIHNLVHADPCICSASDF